MHHLWQIYGKFSDKMLCKREHKMKHKYVQKCNNSNQGSNTINMPSTTHFQEHLNLIGPHSDN